MGFEYGCIDNELGNVEIRGLVYWGEVWGFFVG